MPRVSNPTTYSFAQLEGLWIQAGGDKASAPVMAAIALAESSGNAMATNHNTDGSIDRGLWQINSSNVDSTSMFDPMANAAEAVKIKGSQGLRAWVTYTTGAYRQFLKDNVAPSPVDGVTPITGSNNTSGTQVGIGTDLGTEIGKGLVSVLAPLFNYILWTGEVMIGISLLVGGAVLLLQNSKIGKQSAKVAAMVAAPEAAPAIEASEKTEGEAE